MIDTVAGYHHWNRSGPNEQSNGVSHWYGTTQSFLVEMVEGQAGTVLSVEATPDEWCLIMGTDDTEVEVRAGDSAQRAGRESFTVVPPGKAELEIVRAGRFFRLFSNETAQYRHAAAVVPAHPGPDVRPMTPWPAPDGPPKIRHYRLADYEHLTDRKRIFRCTNFMVNMAIGRDQPRAADDFSPHTHADFEQVTLALRGDFIHHIRRPWGKDSRQWLPDEHVEVGSPSTTIIPAGDVHTLENIGEGPWRHVDIFGPPREDFHARGLVLNAADYPDPVPVA